MEKNVQLYELIDQYISGELEGEELKSFEEKLKTDAELQQEVALQRQMDSVYEDLPKQDLRVKLTQLRKQHDNRQLEQTPTLAKIRKLPLRKSLIRIAAALAILIVSSIIYFNLTSDPAFSKNIALEEQLGDTDEADFLTFKVDPSSSGNTYKLSPKRDFNFRIKGQLKADNLKSNERFVIKVFNNKNELVSINTDQSGMPLAVEGPIKDDKNMAFGEEGQSYPFEHHQNLTLDKGLYYYVITYEGEDDKLFVGKFKVKE